MSTSPPAVTSALPDASALREAALQTKKRKRGDAVSANGAIVAPLPTLATGIVVTLNYGDDSAEPAEPAAADSVALNSYDGSTTVSAGSVVDDGDEADREEGEFSDGELEALAAVRVEKSLLLPSNSVSRPYHSNSQPAHEKGLRPKLQITPGELHEFKLHLLDVLGFGVPPEYLIEYGVSAETLAYALHELNFRQPSNITFPDNDVLFYPESLNESVKVTTTSPSGKGSPTQAMLDIESQKKKELRARMAVLANIKAKKAAAVVETTDPSPPLPEAAVNDFLRSITADGPVLAATPPPPTSDAMQVDVSTLTAITTTTVNRQRSTSDGSGGSPEAGSNPFPRGTKRPRPVAADFDDGDASVSMPSPRLAPSKPATYHRNGVPPPPAPARKASSFAILNDRHFHANHVIELSDSEDDETKASGSVLRGAVPPPRPMSALEQHEAKIREMKEMIAAKQLMKKATKGNVTPFDPATSNDSKRGTQTPTMPSPTRTALTRSPDHIYHTHGAEDIEMVVHHAAPGSNHDSAHPAVDLAVHGSAMDVDETSGGLDAQAARIGSLLAAGDQHAY